MPASKIWRDVRMLELAGERRLGEEQLPEHPAAHGVAQGLGEDALDRHLAPAERVLAQEHLRGGALAELADDRIVGDVLHLGASHLGSRLRARAIAARTCAGAVPPTWLRAATEPSSVSTRFTSAPICGRSCLSVASGSAASPRRRARPRAPRAPPLRARRGTARPCAPGSRRGRWRWRSLRARARSHRLAVDRLMPATMLGEDAQRVLQRVDRVEQRLLVFLVVLVVGERLALHQREQRHQVADHAAGLAAHQLGHVGVLLLRHDRRAGAEAVGELDEAEARAHPQHQLLGKPRQVHHGERGGGAELDREVAVATRRRASSRTRRRSRARAPRARGRSG